ncbi:XVIPCD domain-containing protein [Dyella silvatica]|uniref:XVIPCD domain-containing protein n=1 Tax=Dyella silvatica TaxID=2992128 RepID=UPI002259D116|nr:XVIPCD domain-containing protein [Dyella silvatica]
MPNTSVTPDQLRAVLFSTENGGNANNLNHFSYAGTGNSTYSFGVLQFDVGSDHGGVKHFLADNGFSTLDIAHLSRQGGLTEAQLGELNTKLQAIPSERMDAFTNEQLTKSIDRVDALVGSLQTTNPAIATAISSSPELQLAIADFDNQYTIDGIGRSAVPANGMASYLQGNSVQLPGGTLQLGDSISRSDIQNYINATQYAVHNPTSVANRGARLDTALTGLNLQSATPQQADAAAAQPAPAQTTPTPTPAVAPPAQTAPLRMDNPDHPAFPMFQQARDGVHQLDAEQGRVPDRLSENIAGALAASARSQGLSRIDAVALSEDGAHVWAAQHMIPGALNATASVPAAQAVNTPLERSTEVFQQAAQTQTQAQQMQQQQTQQVQQGQAQPAQPAGLAAQH